MLTDNLPSYLFVLRFCFFVFQKKCKNPIPIAYRVKILEHVENQPLNTSVVCILDMSEDDDDDDGNESRFEQVVAELRGDDGVDDLLAALNVASVNQLPKVIPTFTIVNLSFKHYY